MNIYNLVMKSQGMSGAIARGGIWLGAGGGTENALRLLRNMILTKILAPEAFGLMAIVLAVNTFFESFTQIGIREAIIQNPRGNDYVFLNGAFWLAFIRGLLLFVCAFLIVPLIAGFYEHPELIPMMRLAFVSILFLGSISPGLYSSLKQMNYRKWVFVYNFGSVIGIVTAIVLGMYMKNVWALVIGFTVENGARMLLSYIICPFLPSFRFDRDSLMSLWAFARGVFGMPILMFLYQRADVFVLGKIVSTSMLGMYSIALSLVQIPVMFFTMLISPMLLPALSKYKSDENRLINALLRSSKMVSYVFFPLFAIMAGLAPFLLSTMYSADYAQAATAFRFLTISMAIRVVGTVLVTAFFAIGKPQTSRTNSLIRLLVMMLLIVPAVMYWGINGAAFASAASAFVWFMVFIFNIRKTIGISFPKYFRSVSPGIYASCVIAASTFLLIYVL